MVAKKIIYGCDGRGDGDKPYLTRWQLFRDKLDRFAIYFHKFHRSDADDLHDHPWDFITLILWRGYNEVTFTKNDNLQKSEQRTSKRIYPLTINYRKANHAHRVELINGKPAYTLVLRFKYVRWWGFLVKNQWQIFTEYFKENGC